MTTARDKAEAARLTTDTSVYVHVHGLPAVRGVRVTAPGTTFVTLDLGDVVLHLTHEAEVLALQAALMDAGIRLVRQGISAEEAREVCEQRTSTYRPVEYLTDDGRTSPAILAPVPEPDRS